MYEYNTVFGMDTHARSVTVRAVVIKTGEVRTRRFSNCPKPHEIAEWMQRFPAPHYAAYESGCTGFFLCRELNRLGITTEVIAVSSIPRSTDDKIRKNDRIDAKRLTSELLNPTNSLSRVWLPDEECEGARDISRAHADAVDTMKRAKQQLISFLLRHGHVYSEKTAAGKNKKPFTQEFYSWLKTLCFEEEGARGAFEMHLLAAKDGIEQEKRAKKVVDAFKKKPRWKPYVDGLSALKGVGEVGAFVYATEIGDFSRFRSGRKLPSWTGLVPRLYASGEKNINGSVTKAGNSHVRRHLIEGLNSLVYRSSAQSKMLPGDFEVSDAVRAHAKKGSRRLASRIRHLKKRNKETNVIKTAAAGELIRWIWAIGLMIQEEQQASLHKQR